MLALVDCNTAIEHRVIDAWLADHVPGTHTVALPAPGHGTAAELDALAHLLDDDDLKVLPVRVAWLPEERDGTRRATLSDMLPGRNPYRPPRRRQESILRQHPDRAQVVVGESARVGELRRQWEKTDAEAETGSPRRSFPDFVTRRAALALERAQYHLLGPEYKNPGLVKEELLSSARFRAGLEEVADAPVDDALLDRVEAMLEELVTGWGALFVDVIPSLGRLIYRRGFDPAIDYDAGQVERTREAVRNNSTVMLMSHRSNLDASILSIAMRENGLPRAHGFAGINMAFWPVGPIMRRAGVVFIRREIGKDPVYKYVLREYVGYLIEKRFNLHWSIEGTRSRTGKMLPPKLGLLSYVAGAYLDGRTDDVLLLPTSISFDQLYEISEYADYARGAEKKPEGVGWLVKFTRDQGRRHFGRIYVRYGEPVSMRHFLGANDGPGASELSDDPKARLALQKMAFEVAWRINHATPVSATALVSTMLLGSRGVALTLRQLRTALDVALTYVNSRDVPLTGSARALATDQGALATLDALSTGGGPVTKFAGGEETVWAIKQEHQLAAAFYRNSLIHFFLETAICELALQAAADSESDHEAAFWEYVLQLRDLLKFDFYFQERDEYRASIALEMDRHDANWIEILHRGSADIKHLLASMRPLVSFLILRPFVEAYWIMAKVLVHHPDLLEQGPLIKKALGLGRQYQMQGEISSDEPVSVLLFKTALSLATNRGLLDPAADLTHVRAEFAQELDGLLRRVDYVDRLVRHGWTTANAAQRSTSQTATT
jgi:glycerol-3-phosphate O-acyltransferase